MAEQLTGNVGLVLSGAVAQGGFEAGVLGALAARRPRIRRIAATSSGALNATIAAAGIATKGLDAAVSVLKKLWLEDASWQHIADVPVSDWLHLRGAFDTRRVQALVRRALGEVLAGWRGQPTPIELTLIATNLDGLPRAPQAVSLPTYEQPIRFTEKELVDPDKWGRIANAAAASATFPGLFSPTSFDGAPCIDGGAVNNAPISYVLEAKDVENVVVVTTESPEIPQEASLGGAALVARVAAALINERIAYDLTQAKKTNLRLDVLVRALEKEGLGADAQKRVMAAIDYRRIKLYLVQPAHPLPGDAFSGFRYRAQREQQIREGEQAPLIAIEG